MIVAHPRWSRIGWRIGVPFSCGFALVLLAAVYFMNGGGAGPLPVFWAGLTLVYVCWWPLMFDLRRLTGASVEVGHDDESIRFTEDGVERAYRFNEVEFFIIDHKRAAQMHIWFFEKSSGRRLAIYHVKCPGFSDLVAWSGEHLAVRPRVTPWKLFVAAWSGEPDRVRMRVRGWRGLVAPVVGTALAGAGLLAINLAAASGEHRTWSSMGPTIWWRCGWPFPILFDACHPHFPSFEGASIWRGALAENLLYALGILTLVWLAARRRAGRRMDLGPFSFHLLTVVVLLAGVVTVDLLWRFPPFFLDPDLGRGFWPFRGFPFGTAYVKQWRAVGGSSAEGLVLNLLIWVPALATLAVLCEWLVPRRAPGARGRGAAAAGGGLGALWLVAAAAFGLVYGRGAIFRAVERGDVDEVAALLRNDPGLARRVHEPTGNTPLHVAVRKGHVRLLLPLLRSGADPDAPNLHGYTAVHVAAEEASQESMKVLLANGADPNAEGKSSMAPLNLAADHPGEVHAPATVWLLPGEGEETSRPPLYVAAYPYRGDDAVATVKILLQHGADPDLRASFSGETALARVAGDSLGGDRTEIVEAMALLLLQRGADPDLGTNYGDTPLHRAASGGRLRLCRLLVEKGADVNARDKKRDTPLHNAAEWGGAAVAGFLIEKGADVDARNEAGDTPLHRACASYQDESAEVVKLLVAAGADTGVKNDDGKTPADLAREPGVREALSGGGTGEAKGRANGGASGE